MTATIDNSIEAEAGALAERLFGSALGAIDLYTVYLGVRLGLYETLAAEGECTPAALASSAGIHPRYAREWLEQQTVAGFLVCADREQSEDDRRYLLPAGHAIALLDQDSPAYTASLALATITKRWSLELVDGGRVKPSVFDRSVSPPSEFESVGVS